MKEIPICLSSLVRGDNFCAGVDKTQCERIGGAAKPNVNV